MGLDTGLRDGRRGGSADAHRQSLGARGTHREGSIHDRPDRAPPDPSGLLGLLEFEWYQEDRIQKSEYRMAEKLALPPSTSQNSH